MNDQEFHIEKSQEMLFECDICEKKLLRFNQVVCPKFFKCSTRGKSLKTAEILQKHIKIVHGDQKEFKCDYCRKSVTRISSLRKHVKTVHEGCKDHRCESCGKSFTSVGILRNHIKTVHEGRKD